MNIDNDSLKQIQIEFDERLAALTTHYQQTLRCGLTDRWPQDRAAHHPRLKRFQAFLVQAGTWVRQQLLPPQGQDLPSYEHSAMNIPDEDAVIIIDAEYRVIEADSAQVPRSRREGIVR
jgi:hypothetical protein